ncbi:MAG: asparagine synthase-related protein [Bacteroides sp.]|nr:asparagine synthase-related protein [Bacteroides sp.]
MIYGKLSLKDWRTAIVAGEAPQSVFETYSLRLFFYGTIYNKDVFQTDSDFARIAADAYLLDLKNGFSRLDGSFTIVYFSEDECGIVRDMHGTHSPVYVHANGEFATSLSYFAKYIDKNGLNTPALSRALQRGYIPQDSTPLSDICQIEPGHSYKICKHLAGSADTLPNYSGGYADIRPVVEKAPDVEAYSRRYGELHEQAIRRRIGSSNRVGILLSGGYDSGFNLAALRKVYDGEINSYSVGFKGDTWTELPMTRLMSDTFGTRHHEYEIDRTEINALPDIVRFLGEPFVEGGLMVNYCAMRMIGADKPEVILGGDGSDQYFGTSGREVALHYLAARMGMHPLLCSVDNLLGAASLDTGGKPSRIHFHLDKILHILEGERFGFSDSALCELLQHPQKDFERAKTVEPDIRSFEHLYTQHALVSDLEIVINRIIIYKASRMARMFGNNLTFPFMDLDLFHFLQQLPVGLKCKGDSVWKIARGQLTSKYLLKYHYKPLLSPAIASKKKQGGFAPMPLFFADVAQRARLKDFILSSGIYDNYLRRDAIEKFLSDYDREALQTGVWFWYRQNRALQYFNLLALVTWWEEFVEGKEVRY